MHTGWDRLWAAERTMSILLPCLLTDKNRESPRKIKSSACFWRRQVERTRSKRPRRWRAALLPEQESQGGQREESRQSLQTDSAKWPPTDCTNT